MHRLAVMISGSGSNLQAILDAIDAGALDAQVAIVVSNKSRAYGLERARAAGIETLVFTAKSYRGTPEWRARYDADLADKVAAFAPDLVVLAGWMHVLSPAFLGHCGRRVINLHPALPGHFAGTHAIQRAFDAFQTGEIEHTGVMVHWVIPEVDAGDPIAVAQVPIESDDTVESLEKRVHEVEHQLIVQAIQQALQAMDKPRQAPIGS